MLIKGGDPDFVKVLDFGIAKVPIDQIAKDAPADAPKSGHVITRAGMVFRYPEYMAPSRRSARTWTVAPISMRSV